MANRVPEVYPRDVSPRPGRVATGATSAASVSRRRGGGHSSAGRTGTQADDQQRAGDDRQGRQAGRVLADCDVLGRRVGRDVAASRSWPRGGSLESLPLNTSPLSTGEGAALIAQAAADAAGDAAAAGPDASARPDRTGAAPTAASESDRRDGGGQQPGQAERGEADGERVG